MKNNTNKSLLWGLGFSVSSISLLDVLLLLGSLLTLVFVVVSSLWLVRSVVVSSVVISEVSLLTISSSVVSSSEVVVSSGLGLESSLGGLGGGLLSDFVPVIVGKNWLGFLFDVVLIVSSVSTSLVSSLSAVSSAVSSTVSSSLSSSSGVGSVFISIGSLLLLRVISSGGVLGVLLGFSFGVGGLGDLFSVLWLLDLLGGLLLDWLLWLLLLESLLLLLVLLLLLLLLGDVVVLLLLLLLGD